MKIEIEDLEEIEEILEYSNWYDDRKKLFKEEEDDE
jgi:hypothetical protein